MAIEKESVLEHIEVLRKKIIVVIAVLGIFSVLGFLFSKQILNHITNDLIGLSDVNLIVTHPLDLFYMQINAGIFIGIVASMPVLLYQAYSFIRPALEKGETRAVKVGLFLGLLLFILGIAFSYFVLIRVIVWFFSGMAGPAGVENLWNINYFMSFVVFTCILMGLVFQTPIILSMLLFLGIIERDYLKQNRGYLIIGMFVIAALITPPDPITQVLVALPLIILYEISIFSSRFFIKEKTNN